MPAATTYPKNATIQIRLPFDAKKKIGKRALQLGLSISEYARTALLIDSGSLNREIESFWQRIEKSEAQHRAGEHKLTSADELFEIGLKARQK
jgi:hypothetical protein